jgi:hypothetical protein
VVALEHPAEVLVGWYRQVREHPSADDKPRDADVETIRQRVGGREVS